MTEMDINVHRNAARSNYFDHCDAKLKLVYIEMFIEEIEDCTH